MKSLRTICKIFFILTLFKLVSCQSGYQKNEEHDSNRLPFIEPDYLNVTIPVNIAPMNFWIREQANCFNVDVLSSNGYHYSVKSSDGLINFPLNKWKKLLWDSEGGKIELQITACYKDRIEKYKSFSFYIAPEQTDPFICYRLLYPGYEANVQLKIMQRSINNFSESTVLDNLILNTHCLNCHTFYLKDPSKFLVQIRGSAGGTYFINDTQIQRLDLKLGDLTHKPGVVYPTWHPEGRYATFSSNHLTQIFQAIPGKRIEGIDLASFLLLFDTESNELLAINNQDDSLRYMDTYPEWTPDGEYLYFCRAAEITEGFDFKDIKYDLVRKKFEEQTRSFGKAEIVFDAKAINKSVSFPKISPDYKYLVFTLHDYGNFSAWHKEADLYIINMENGISEKMNLNSQDTESYHSWSSNSRWLIFSSKRGDGLTARPYIAYVDSNGVWGKPFVLPQKDPSFYNNLLLTYNLPEFITGKIKVNPRNFRRAAKKTASKAKWTGDRVINVN